MDGRTLVHVAGVSSVQPLLQRLCTLLLCRAEVGTNALCNPKNACLHLKRRARRPKMDDSCRAQVTAFFACGTCAVSERHIAVL
jgi:hypothetical protein